jgi:hypothetical protein
VILVGKQSDDTVNANACPAVAHSTRCERNHNIARTSPPTRRPVATARTVDTAYSTSIHVHNIPSTCTLYCTMNTLRVHKRHPENTSARVVNETTRCVRNTRYGVFIPMAVRSTSFLTWALSTETAASNPHPSEELAQHEQHRQPANIRRSGSHVPTCLLTSSTHGVTRYLGNLDSCQN